MGNVMGRDKRVDAALIELQRAATVDGVWKASVKLMRAAMPTYNVLLGLVSLGIMPMFMRATKPIPNVERFAQLAPLNDVIRERPLTPVARMSDDYSPDTPNGRALLEEFLKPMGWRHGAALLFWNADGGFRGQLTVIRTEQQGDYSDAEMDFLRELHPHVEAVIDRLFALEQAFAAHLSLEHAIDALPLPIVIAGWDGGVSYSNAAARDAMSAWRHGSAASSRAFKPARKLPAEIESACREMKSRWEQAALKDDFGRLTRHVSLDHSSAPGLRGEIQLVESRAGRAMQPSFAISFHLQPLPAGSAVSGNQTGVASSLHAQRL